MRYYMAALAEDQPKLNQYGKRKRNQKNASKRIHDVESFSLNLSGNIRN